MARPQINLRETFRKLSKVGGGRSYSLTIPKEFIRELGWQEHQKLILEKRGNEIVIRDWE